MHAATHTTQVATPFGNGYVPEQHADFTHFSLSEVDGVVTALTGAMFDEVMKALRAALSLR